MSRKLKKAPRWLQAALAFLLVVLVLVVLLPTGQKEPALIPAVVQNMESDSASNPAFNSEREIDFAYEELTEEKSLQAPKNVPLPVHNGYPESGIALVMDDIGYDLKALKRILALPFPVAISILPDAPRAHEAATMAHEAGKIVMLHLPMEPTSPKYRSRMTDAFLRTDMNKTQIRERTYLALQQVPYVVGINNHMGSLLTTLKDPMKWVMQICKERALFFVDSKTSNSSVAADIASEYGLIWGCTPYFSGSYG